MICLKMLFPFSSAKSEKMGVMAIMWISIVLWRRHIWAIQANYSQVGLCFCLFGPSGSTKIAVLAHVKNCLFLRRKLGRFSNLEIAVWSYAHRQIVILLCHYGEFWWMISMFLGFWVFLKSTWRYSQRCFVHNLASRATSSGMSVAQKWLK